MIKQTATPVSGVFLYVPVHAKCLFAGLCVQLCSLCVLPYFFVTNPTMLKQTHTNWELILRHL